LGGGEIPLTREQRRLAAILAADVVGYSRLMGRDESGTLARLREHRRQRFEPTLARHGGRLVKLTGDGALVEFPSAVDALSAAIEFQQAMAEANKDLPEDTAIVFRIGLHLGDLIVDGDDLYGDGVNVAARLEAETPPGGIVVSRAVREAVDGRLKAKLHALGELSLKNIERPIRAFRVEWEAADWKATAAPAPKAVPDEPTAPAPTTPALALPDKPSIAVLPFQNMSGDPEQEYFADGMVEDIITELSRIRWLFVIARNSTFTYKGQAVDVKRVARELGVRYVLEGSVRKGGNRVRITAQLIDAISGAHIWAERYDRDLNDIFAVQDEITASVAGVIEPALAEAEQQRVLRKPPERLDAWEAYQRGLWHFNKYGPEENQIAQTFFRRVIALDPNFAPGHYGYALALQWEIWHFSTRPFSEVQGIPLEEARIAVSLDDKDATAHAVLAHMRMWDGEWEVAIAEARTALALNPNSSFVISMLGCVLGFGGYREEALDRLRQAMRVSPNDPLTWLWLLWTGAIQFYSRKFDAAVETLHQVVRLRPGGTSAQVVMAAALAHLGRLDEARDHLSRARAHFQDPRYQQMPWIRPEDNALRAEGLRLAAGEMK
jgi:adenylate cyclase